VAAGLSPERGYEAPTAAVQPNTTAILIRQRLSVRSHRSYDRFHDVRDYYRYHQRGGLRVEGMPMARLLLLPTASVEPARPRVHGSAWTPSPAAASVVSAGADQFATAAACPPCELV